MIFDRTLYKRTAKSQLKTKYGITVPVTIILILENFLFELLTKRTPQNIVSILSFLQFAITAIISLATVYFFINFAKSKNDLFSVSFSTWLDGLNLWLKAILSSLWTCLWILLWFLVFIIPGVVKAVAYSQINFIIAENPKISVRKALQLSIQLTQNHKGQLLMMYLSFIGWFCLSILTCGIALFWVIPYIQLSLANAYLGLKQLAFQNRTLAESDFS